MKDKKNVDPPRTADDSELDQVSGGLVIPAIQQVREAPVRTSAADQGGGPRVKILDGTT